MRLSVKNYILMLVSDSYYVKYLLHNVCYFLHIAANKENLTKGFLAVHRQNENSLGTIWALKFEPQNWYRSMHFITVGCQDLSNRTPQI